MREFDEEPGLALPLSGPAYHAAGTFEFRTELLDNVDAFKLAHFAGGEITLDGVNAAQRSVLSIPPPLPHPPPMPWPRSDRSARRR